MHRVIGAVVLAFISGVNCQAFDPVITAAPIAVDVHERQAPASNFLGYTSSGDGFGIATCNSGDFYTTSSRWGGCVDGVRHLAIGCTKTSMVIYDATTVTCPSSIPVCDTVMAYANPDKTTGLSVIRCFGDKTAREAYYRDTSTSSSAASTTADSIATSASTGLTEPVTDSTPVSTVTSFVDVTDTFGVTVTGKSSSATSTGSVSSDTNGAGGNSGGGQKSLAWIAGPVVGGIAGIAIIALLVWVVILLRRRSAERRQAGAAHHEANMPEKRASEAYSMSYPTPGQQPGRVVSAELSSDQVPPQMAELQAAQYKQSAGHRYGAELE